MSVRQSTPYLGCFHFLLKELTEVCTESTFPPTNCFILCAISPVIFLPTAEEEGRASSQRCKHLPFHSPLFGFTVSVRLRVSWPSKGLHKFWGARIWPSWHRTAQEFLIFFHFFLKVSAPTSRVLTWSVRFSPPKPMVSITKTLTCGMQVTSFLIKWSTLIVWYPTNFSFPSLCLLMRPIAKLMGGRLFLKV